MKTEHPTTISDDPLEKVIEKKIKAYGKTIGFLSRKFISPGSNGVPDQLFINQNGIAIFIEMKRKGETPTPAQGKQIRKFKANLAPTFVVDNIEIGCQILDAWKDRVDVRP